jgi:nucleoside phosphorylase
MDIPVVLTRLAGLVRKRKEEDSWPYHLFLTRYLLQHSTGEGYRALARLIREGYFSTILTSNKDTALELALEEYGLHPPRYEILAVGQVSNERIAAILEGPGSGVRIIKLYGNRSQGDQNASLFNLPSDIKTSLQHYFNQNIIIVGCMDQEEDGISALHSHKEGNIYYVLQNTPSHDDIVVKSLRKQDKRLDDFHITGPYGEFNTFFRVLETSINQTLPTLRSNAMYVKDVSPSRSHLGGQSPVLDKKVGLQSGLQPLSSSGITRPLPVLADAPMHIKNFSHISDKMSADVLLITVTDVEARAIFDLFPKKSQKFIDGRIYYDLGLVGTSRTFMAQSTGPGPIQARICIEEGIKTLLPPVVIMVGIAFGSHPEKQKIGDILVSQQIENYDQQKIGTSLNGQREIYVRGDRVPASERLLSRFKAGQHDWQAPPDIHFGLILSGSKLVSNKDFRDELLRVAPEAIGGEMEGGSLYEVGNSKHVEWVLVKAICDWADAGKNDAHQMLAAKNAACFVVQVVGQDQFVRQR